MRLDNKTRWNTEDLRKLVDETYRRLATEESGPLRFRCPECGARPEAACISESLRTLARPHKARLSHARGLSGKIEKPKSLQFTNSTKEKYKAVWKTTTGRPLSPKGDALLILLKGELFSRHVALHVEDLFRFGRSQDRSLRPLGQDLRRFDWAEEFPIRRDPPKPKPKRADVIVRELQRFRAGEKRWITKYKLASTKLKVIRQKIRYYEKQFQKELAKESVDG